MLFLKQARALLKPKRKRSKKSDVRAGNEILVFPYTEIQSATNNFSPELVSHRDEFGPEYEGTLSCGTKVTVKRLDPKGSMGSHEFKNEIVVLAPIRHPHIVSLIGCCIERGERIVVYEYVGKENLRDRLCVGNSEGYLVRSILSWEERLRICIDSAEAIHYLHSGSVMRVIHRDVKTRNILVDENLRAKLTGLDIAKLCPFGGEPYHTKSTATFEYLDPEYFRTEQLTEKSDVYSFGAVLLEVLCARPVVASLLAKWGMLWHRKGQLERIIDPVLVGNVNSASFKRYCETIELCLGKNIYERPGMREVIWNLEMALELQLY